MPWGNLKADVAGSATAQDLCDLWASQSAIWCPLPGPSDNARSVLSFFPFVLFDWIILSISLRLHWLLFCRFQSAGVYNLFSLHFLYLNILVIVLRVLEFPLESL